MKIDATLRWITLALIGIAIAAAISVAASRLSSQRIGLASEPISAGDRLAPPRKTATIVRHKRRHAPQANRQTSSVGSSTQPSAPSSVAPGYSGGATSYSGPASSSSRSGSPAPKSTRPSAPKSSGGGEAEHQARDD